MEDPDPLAALPACLRDLADITGSGELLWPAEAAGPVIGWMASHRIGILAIEVYGRVDMARGILHYDSPTLPGRGPDEPWESFVRRGAEQAKDAVRRNESKFDRAESTAASDRRYFIASCTEDHDPRRRTSRGADPAGAPPRTSAG